MSDKFSYDVFLSYSSKDRVVAQQLARMLKSDGLRVWLDDWVIRPGDLIGIRIEQGLEQSRTLVLLMSANAFSSDWVTLERQTALFRDPTNALRRFIPVRLDDCQIQDTLSQFAYVDWRQQSEAEYEKLLAGCKPAEVESAEPSRSHTLQAHATFVWGVAVTPDGKYAVTGSGDSTLRKWYLRLRRRGAILSGHSGGVPGVALTSDGKTLVSGSHDRSVRVWDLNSNTEKAILWGHTSAVVRVAVTPDGMSAASASQDGTIRVWNLREESCMAVLTGHVGKVFAVSIAADGQRVVSGGEDRTLRIWDVRSKSCTGILEGHADSVYGLALTADGRIAVSSSNDRTLRVWDVHSLICLAKLEGHTRGVYSVAVTPDGTRAVSASEDETIRAWDLKSGVSIATLEGTCPAYTVAITSDGKRVVTGNDDGTIRFWELSAVTTEVESTRYTNAKVLLVGETGVGKTGLALRLTQDRFEPTVSTDGAWATQLRLPTDENAHDFEREVWLWDFGGQADYRLIHQLFMDETALAVLVFNPQSEDPFDGLRQWDRALTRAARRSFEKILCAGRCDRGGLMVSKGAIERFCNQHRFAQYIATSALTGSGCAELKSSVLSRIPWQAIPWTSSPRIFKVLKETILQLKDEGKVLLRLSELKQQLEMRLSEDPFTFEELRAVIGLLAGPAVVWQLEFGDFILLQPERINAYAAAVIRSVRAHTDEIGCIPEHSVLTGALDYQDMRRLPGPEEQIVLRAMHQIFVNHGLCLREHTEAGPLLVFPSYFRRERQELEQHPAVIVTYQFGGSLDEIYATLVVRLHHTPAFQKDELWWFAADFKTPEGRRVGLKMNKNQDGTAKITVYCEPSVPDDTKVMFIRYVHDHLKANDPNLVRIRHYLCPHCHLQVENRHAIKTRLARGLKDILCSNCENRILLWDLIEQKFASDEVHKRVRELEQQARTSIDNESRELILLGHAYAVAGEAGQIFRLTPNSDWGIDGEIEFKNYNGKASGKRVYLQLKSGDSYLRVRSQDGAEVFTIKNERHVEYWQAQAYPVMLVIRSSDGTIRWMDVTEYLKGMRAQDKAAVVQVVFKGEPFTALSVQRLRDKLVPFPLNSVPKA